MKLSQLLDAGQVERLLQSLARIVPLALRVMGPDGTVLAAVTPAHAAADAEAPPADRATPASEQMSRAEVQAPIEIHGERIGYVTGLPLDPGREGDRDAVAAVELVARILAEEAYREHELNSLSTELLSKYEEITLLYDLSQALGSVFDIRTICEIALEKAVQAVPAAKAFVMLKEEHSECLTVVAARVDGLLGWKTPIGQGISGQAAASGRPILLHEGEPFPSRGPEGETHRDAVLSVPLIRTTEQGTEEILGVMTLAGKPPGEMFTAGDVKLVTTIATQLAVAIHNSRLVDALREAERVRQELEIAARIQQSLLPDHPPQVPGVELAGQCVPAANVGGDYYDFLTDEAGRLTLLIADVSGHSVGSALMMAMARSILRREIAQSKSPADVLADTNTAMLHDLVRAGLFITLFCACYDPVARRLTFANGGHNPPLLRRSADGQVMELDSDGMIVGILDDVSYEERSITLDPGDVLVLYTDGIIEARNPEGEQFGEDRLQGILGQDGALPAGMLAERIYRAVRRHSQEIAQQDDITLLVLKVQEDS